MFRTTPSPSLTFLLSHAVLASDPLSDSGSDEGTLGNGRKAYQITDDHVQGQLDWRSYYLNRMAVRRPGFSQKPGTGHRHSPVHTN